MPFATIVIVAAAAAPAIVVPAEFERQHGTLPGAAVIVAARARGAARVAVVDGLGHVPAAVLALVACAGRRHNELAGALPDGRVEDVPAVEHTDGHPRRQVAHELAACAWRQHRVVVSTATASAVAAAVRL